MTRSTQVAVFLAYASPRGRALIDRTLYLPTSWTDDPDRCAAAGVPAQVAFATKPQLAGDMIEDARDGGVQAGWVAADEVYGNDPVFRTRLRTRGVGYVLAISSRVTIGYPSPVESCDCAPTGWPPTYPRAAGSGCPPVPARKAHASTTGPGST